LALAGLATLAMGALLAGFSPAVAQGETDPQNLAVGDKIQITVSQQPEFSGDFVIDGSGSVVLPIVGAIEVQDLPLSEAEKRIAERLADGYLQRPIVNLKFSEHRPVYVLGEVRNPGSYPYRYGVSVLNAVASAGGLAMSEQTMPSARADFLQADERLRVLEVTHRILFLRRARLEAQRAGTRKIELSPEAPYSRDDPDVARILDEEQDILSAQRTGHEQALRLLRDQKPRLEAEIAGVRAQSDAEQKQLQLLQEHIADYNKLLSNGLARRYAMIELQREEARHKGNLARYTADIARLEISIGEVGVRIQEAENEYMRRIITDLQESRARLQEAEITMPVARELRETRFQVSSAAMIGTATQAPYAITILRMRNGQQKSFQADGTTLLVPGDIIEVRRAGPRGLPASTMPLLGGVALQASKTIDGSKASID
jgi:polysaccharide export outer membrane protein